MKNLFFALALFMGQAHASEGCYMDEEELLEKADVAFLGKWVRDDTPVVVFPIRSGETMVFPGFRFEVVWNIKNADSASQIVYLVDGHRPSGLTGFDYMASRTSLMGTGLDDPNYQGLFFVAGNTYDDRRFGGWPLMDGKLIGNGDCGQFYVVPRNEESEIRARLNEALRNNLSRGR